MASPQCETILFYRYTWPKDLLLSHDWLKFDELRLFVTKAVSHKGLKLCQFEPIMLRNEIFPTPDSIQKSACIFQGALWFVPENVSFSKIKRIIFYLPRKYKVSSPIQGLDKNILPGYSGRANILFCFDTGFCLCVRERERETERVGECDSGGSGTHAHTHTKKTNERKPHGMFFLFGPVIG